MYLSAIEKGKDFFANFFFPRKVKENVPRKSEIEMAIMDMVYYNPKTKRVYSKGLGTENLINKLL